MSEQEHLRTEDSSR